MCALYNIYKVSILVQLLLYIYRWHSIFMPSSPPTALLLYLRFTFSDLANVSDPIGLDFFSITTTTLQYLSSPSIPSVRAVN